MAKGPINVNGGQKLKQVVKLVKKPQTIDAKKKKNVNEINV